MRSHHAILGKLAAVFNDSYFGLMQLFVFSVVWRVSVGSIYIKGNQEKKKRREMSVEIESRAKLVLNKW